MIDIKALAHLAVISCLFLTQSATAEESALTNRLQDCSQIEQDQARLTCFDGLTASIDLAVVVSSNAIISGPMKPSAADIDAFGKEQLQKSAEELAQEVNHITLTVSKLAKSVRGQWKITFVNGQKWQQNDSTSFRIKTGDRVVLSKGALGAVYLKKEHTHKRINVKRLK